MENALIVVNKREQNADRETFNGTPSEKLNKA